MDNGVIEDLVMTLISPITSLHLLHLSSHFSIVLSHSITTFYACPNVTLVPVYSPHPNICIPFSLSFFPLSFSLL